MNSANNSSHAAQLVEDKREVSGKLRTKARKRLAAKHVPDKVRDRIVNLMYMHESSDRVADIVSREDEFPGVTGKTVMEVLWLRTLPAPRPAQQQRAFAMAAGRTA